MPIEVNEATVGEALDPVADGPFRGRLEAFPLLTHKRGWHTSSTGRALDIVIVFSRGRDRVLRFLFDGLRGLKGH